ncbi:hypothetical protein B0H66DRAFT_569114 [Apodospora peruviana]|uniref:Secreted protein n=1 Tax=Apodospora peruviana TaxID=516989 RepID=A0AAE0HUL0_9PEZI|nr:hypothetical protein B0H66DRAFT_569114 [Apodospora peruviana]
MLGIISSLLLLSGVLAQTFDPSAVSLNVTYSGNGCPQGSISTSFSPDRTAITIGFDSVYLSIGPSSAAALRSRNCAVHFQLSYPPAWRFIVAGSRWHGYFALDGGVSATLYTTYELRSVDLRVINVPTLNVTGDKYTTAGSEGALFDAESLIAAGDQIGSICSSKGTSPTYSDVLDVRDRFALQANRAGAQQDGFTVEGTTFAQQIKLKWVACNY